MSNNVFTDKLVIRIPALREAARVRSILKVLLDELLSRCPCLPTP